MTADVQLPLLPSPFELEPLTERLSSNVDLSQHVTGERSCDLAPLELYLCTVQERKFPQETYTATYRRYKCPTTEQYDAAKNAKHKELEMRLKLVTSENITLRKQVKQQFKDLSELDNVMGELEVQVDGHEEVIKHQSQRIQEQEEMIQSLNLKMQQYAAMLLLSVYKSRPQSDRF